VLTLGPHTGRSFGLHSNDHSDFERIEAFKARTFEKLRDVRCPEHRQSPRVRFYGASLREVTISMSACCDRLIRLANQAIGAER
jgi:hypothetical protein